MNSNQPKNHQYNKGVIIFVLFISNYAFIVTKDRFQPQYPLQDGCPFSTKKGTIPVKYLFPFESEDNFFKEKHRMETWTSLSRCNNIFRYK